MTPTTLSQPQQARRAAALDRVRTAAAAEGLAPARIVELENSLTAAFAIKDLMDVFGQRNGG